MLTSLAAWAGLPALDVPAAAVVVVLIAIAGLEILAANARYLVDASLVPPQRIRAALAGIDGIAAIRAIRSRGTPDAVFVDLRIGLAADLRVREAAAIVRRIERAVASEVDAIADVMVHIECEPEPLASSSNHRRKS